MGRLTRGTFQFVRESSFPDSKRREDGEKRRGKRKKKRRHE